MFAGSQPFSGRRLAEVQRRAAGSVASFEAQPDADALPLGCDWSGGASFWARLGHLFQPAGLIDRAA